ncbi:unnamed protein product [Diatraea saccharalis]|uniref:CRAL-TRIO domain-containing protein n=1 Tax=Diatraea saccharalis TaxID=40085 RepID=A0A9N9R8A5_9NEOP|nr:unnamed protein product [Diatraea saccharalis]
MSRAASFAERWARNNLTRKATEEELTVLSLFFSTCNGDEMAAARRARRYYKARGPGGLTELWHGGHPDDEDILASCQDTYIVPLETRSVGGRRLTLIQLPASPGADTHDCGNCVLSAKALLRRWLMILDVRLREDPTPGEEMVFIDVANLQLSHVKDHFIGSYWKDFVQCIKSAHPFKFSEVHMINTKRMSTLMSFLMLHIGLYSWGRKKITLHPIAKDINKTMDIDYYPVEALPNEYGGKAGAMKYLNDEWTKKILSNSKWLEAEKTRFYNTELKLEQNAQSRHRSVVRLHGTNKESYDMITRTHSCRSLNRQEDLDEGTYGAYRTLKVQANCDFIV